MKGHDIHAGDNDATVDPNLDRLLRELIQRPRLSGDQHERIRGRIGLSKQTHRPTPLWAASRTRATTDRRDDDVVARHRLNEEEQEPIMLSNQTWKRQRHQWMELAAVLVVILVAVAAFAIIRGGDETPSQQGVSPGTPVATPGTTPTTEVAPTTTPTTGVTTPTPDTATATPPAIPTPNANGVYENLTPEQAQSLVPFDLLVASELFSDLATLSVEILDPGDGSMTIFEARQTYALADGEALQGLVEVRQTNRRPQNPPGGEMSITELGGQQINKAIIPFESQPDLAVYTCHYRGTFLSISARIEGEVTIERVERLVADLAANMLATYDEGETVDGETYAVTVVDARVWEDVGIVPAPAGSLRLLVEGTLDYRGAESVSVILFLNARLSDASGKTYDVEVTSVGSERGPVQPGETASFKLGFTVPADALELVLTFGLSEETTDDDLVFVVSPY